MFFFLILIQWTLHSSKSLLVNVKQMLRKSWVNKLRRQRCCSGPLKGPTPPPKFPDQVGLDVLFGGAARNRHMFGVSSGFGQGFGESGLWLAELAGLGVKAALRITHVFCFTPLPPPPKKKWTNVPWKGTISKRKNRIPSPWCFRVNKSLFFTRCFWGWNFITISFGIWQIFKFQTASTRVTQ